MCALWLCGGCLIHLYHCLTALFVFFFAYVCLFVCFEYCSLHQICIGLNVTQRRHESILVCFLCLSLSTLFTRHSSLVYHLIIYHFLSIQNSEHAPGICNACMKTTNAHNKHTNNTHSQSAQSQMGWILQSIEKRNAILLYGWHIECGAAMESKSHIHAQLMYRIEKQKMKNLHNGGTHNTHIHCTL